MSIYIKYPSAAPSGVPVYASLAAFPVFASIGDLGVAADTGNLFEWNGSAWIQIGGPGSAHSLGNLDAQAPTAKGAALVLGVLSMQSADATRPGLVNNATQSFSGNKTFTGTISASNLSGTNTGDVTIGTANGLSLIGQVLSLQLSSASQPGALSAADWTTFNAKQPAGAYITALTGDATAAGPGSAALTLATVNGSPGSFGSASVSLSATVNAKGLITALSSQSIQIAESQVTNLVSDLAGKQPVGNYITALTGDATASGPGSAALTLATVNGSPGSFGSASSSLSATVNAKGLITALSSQAILITESQVTNLVSDLAGKQPAGAYITALTGDATAAGPGSAALTLATVNGSPGSFGSASTSLSATVNAKGLITALSSQSIQIAESQVTNLVNDLAGKQSATLTNAHILVGNGSNVATDVAASGDLTLANTGAFTIANSAVTNAKIANATIDLTAKVTGLLPLANGGTNANLTAVNGAIAYSDASKLQLSAAGTAGQILSSSGAGAPTWTTQIRNINAQSGTTYTFVLADGNGAGGEPLLTFGNATATTVTVPTNASVAFPIGTQIDCIQQGAGKVTFAAAGGVTINSSGGKLSIGAQYVGVSLVKTATDVWTLIGNLIT